MPATRADLLEVVFRTKLPELRSLVVCLEDAVAEIDVDTALKNLHGLLTAINERGGRPSDGPLLFVRPRDSVMAAVLNEWPLMAHVDGFVVPKLTLRNLGTGNRPLRTRRCTSCRRWKLQTCSTQVQWSSWARR
jgi:citrate lyase beta subunit